MTNITSATDDIGPPPRPIRPGFVAVAIQPWKLIVRAMMRRTTYRALHALDDHLLKDIGISRGSIERIARDAAGTARQRTFTTQPLTQPNQRRNDMRSKTASPQKAAREPVAMNGVDTPTLLATINAVGGQPELAKFQFRAKSRWISGTRSESTMHGYFGAGGEHQHIAPYKADGDHPAVLCGTDAGPTPVEWVLHALASCLTAGIANIAAARGIRLKRVESTVEGNIDLRGILGLSNEVRNGYQGIKVSFEIDGDASPDQLEKIIMQSKARSAVFDVVTNGVPVSIGVKTPAMA
ncbi:MAG TPA: OsmC family protein [Aestuariivirga sp.]|nr:OsmC family protein [Aestuariivirga sp.]